MNEPGELVVVVLLAGAIVITAGVVHARLTGGDPVEVIRSGCVATLALLAWMLIGVLLWAILT